MNQPQRSAVAFASVGEVDGGVPTLSASMADTLGEIIDAIVATDQMLSSVAAYRAELIDQARQWSELTQQATRAGRAGGWDAAMTARRVVVTEIACALRLPERTAERLVSDSHCLVQELPATLGALRGGEISYRHAQALADHANSLPQDARHAFEIAVLPAARKLTVAKFDRKARVEREKVHPETIAARREKCATDRYVSVTPDRDGMAWFNAYLPAENAIAIDNRLGEIARGLKGREEDRTLAQLRADALTDLLIDGTTTAVADRHHSVGKSGRRRQLRRAIGRGIRARVLVTVPVMTLLGLSEEPASLEGYGPIDADTARRLAGHAPSFTRLLTHPETGAVLSVGRDRYRVPEDLRTWLQVRDETCRFPGCNRRAACCDLDHSIDWQHDGQTRHDNLAHACEGHHQLKHHTGWQVKHLDAGTLEWTSPTGHVYTTDAATKLPSA